jgi:hypothetical protein
VAEIYHLPDDVTQLGHDELETHLSAAVKSFKAESATTTVTPQTLPALRSLKASITALKEEQSARTAAAEAAAAEIDQLSAEVFGEPEPAAETVELSTETGEAPALEGEIIDPVPVIEPIAVTASVRRSSLDLSAVRAKQGGVLTRYNAPDPSNGIEIVASVDVPGFRPGQAFEIEDITEGVMRRATGLKTAGGGTGMVASYRLPFTNDLSVGDASSAPEGSKAMSWAVDQRRLEGGNLVASGGWCAPSETLYDIVDVACPDMLLDVPEIQLNRGGLRFFRPPALDVNALTWIHTEQDDIAGTEKPCFVIPCAAPIDVRCSAIGVCLQAGILTQRFFPEMIDWYVRNSMVAHEIRIKTAAYAAARTASTAVTTTVTFGAFSAVYGAVALQAADMIERFNLCDSISLEVVFPWWTRNLFMADIARQRGVKPGDLDPNIIQDAFTSLGVRVQWARGLTPDVPTNIGGAVPAVAWPADMEFLIYPAGNFVLGRGAEVNLGVIIDSVTVATNDEKIFSEECAIMIDRLGMSRVVTVTVCPNGLVGGEITDACPIA